MPRSFSIPQGGIAPRWLRSAVLAFIALAQGRASSYVSSDMGATESGRWQAWHFRCRMGAISFVKVTAPACTLGADWALRTPDVMKLPKPTATATIDAIRRRQIAVMARASFSGPVALRTSYSKPSCLDVG